MVCEVEGCLRARHARGWCLKHYTRWLRHGAPLETTRFDHDLSVELRFWSRVACDLDSRCWLWQAGVNNYGYGQLLVNGQHIYAHRFSYELLRETIPDGLELDHLCHEPSCVNPDHLEPVTHRMNLERLMRTGRYSKTQRCLACNEIKAVQTEFMKHGVICRTCSAAMENALPSPRGGSIFDNVKAQNEAERRLREEGVN